MEVVSSTLQHREMKGSLVAIIILVLICATVFAVRKGIAARASAENWLVEKKRTTISCDPGNNRSKNNIPYGNNGNGCSHMGTPCPLLNAGNRRYKIHSG
jgi:hypothetical protein